MMGSRSNRRAGTSASRALLAAVLLLCGGCTMIRTESGQPIEVTALPEPGESVHYRDVLARLGPPNRMSASESELLFLYEHISSRERQLGLSLDIEWLNLFKFNYGRGETDREAAVMVFDPDGDLRACHYATWADDLGGGIAVQFIVSILSVVDTSELEADPFQHHWAARLLEPNLAVGLNDPHSLETGRAGLEQRGTPDHAGQHALESRQIIVED